MPAPTIIPLGAVLAVAVWASASMAQVPEAGTSREQARDDAGRERVPARPLGPGGVGGRGAITPVTLIMSSAVQEELKITAAQKKRIFDINDEFNLRRRRSAQRLIRSPGGVDQGALMEMIATLRAENEAAIARVLGSRQRARLAQIALQLEGPLAVARPDVAARINLAPDQWESIREILGRYTEAEAALWDAQAEGLRAAPGRRPDPPIDRGGDAGAGGGRTAQDRRGPAGAPREGAGPESPSERLRRQSVTLQDEAIRQVGRVLTRKQKDAFQRLLGPPFDLATLPPNGGRSPAPLPPPDAPTDLRPIPADAAPLPGPEPQGAPHRASEPGDAGGPRPRRP